MGGRTGFWSNPVCRMRVCSCCREEASGSWNRCGTTQYHAGWVSYAPCCVHVGRDPGCVCVGFGCSAGSAARSSPGSSMSQNSPCHHRATGYRPCPLVLRIRCRGGGCSPRVASGSNARIDADSHRPATPFSHDGTPGEEGGEPSSEWQAILCRKEP